MSDIISTTALRNSLLATEGILDSVELAAGREGKPYQWSPAQAVRDAVEQLDQLDEVRAKLAALFALLDIEEDSELTGKSFRPNHFTSCRALDGEQMGKLLVELKAWATSTP